jgi:hypothetical protein
LGKPIPQSPEPEKIQYEDRENIIYIQDLIASDDEADNNQNAPKSCSKARVAKPMNNVPIFNYILSCAEILSCLKILE